MTARQRTPLLRANVLLILWISVAWTLTVPAGKQVARASELLQEGGVSGVYGDPSGIYLSFSLTGVEITRDEYIYPIHYIEANYTGEPVHFSGEMIVSAAEGYTTYGKMSATLADQRVIFPAEGESDQISGASVKRTFNLTYTLPPGDTNSSIDGGAFVEHCGGVCEAINVWITINVPPQPTPTPTLTPEPTETPKPPERQVTLEGNVYALGASLWTLTPSFPIVDIPVTLLSEGQPVDSTISQAPDGSFSLLAPTGTDLVLRTQLAHEATSPSAFQVVYDQASGPVVVDSEPFQIPTDAPEVVARDLVLAADQGVHAQAVPDEHLADLGAIYFYSHQAWEEASDHLGLTWDLAPPLDIQAFTSNPDFSDGRAACAVPVSDSSVSSTQDPYIGLPPEKSKLLLSLQSSVIWHEFGHYVQTEVMGDRLPYDSQNTYHNGYTNSSTTDSWTEGFATFYALLVQRDVEKQPRPLLSINGWEMNFEFPYYMPWAYVSGISAEELVVTSLLWDLVDEVENITELEASNQKLAEYGISLGAPIQESLPVQLYGDFIQISTQDLFTILSKDFSQLDPSSAAGSYPYIFDIRQLYRALQQEGIGSQASSHPGLTRLDELFIAHGFFADTQPQNLYYDTGEQVGYTANSEAMIVGDNIQVPPRANPLRREPPVPKSFLEYEVVDSNGAPLDVHTFEVTVEFAGKNQDYSYTFETHSLEPGRLLVLAPDPSFPAVIRIRLQDEQYTSTPLEITSQAYWEQISQHPGELLGHFTFQATPLLKPSFVSGLSKWRVPLIAGACALGLLFFAMLFAGVVMLFRRKN